MYSEGDLLKVLGVTDSGVEEQWYAEVVGVLSDERSLEVFWLEPGADRVYRFSEDWDTISYDSVELHVPVSSKTRKAYLEAWSSLGFVAGGDGESFCRKEDEATVSLPIGDCDTDDEEEESLDAPRGRKELQGYESDDGFVVPDDEAFTFAEADNDYVRETHEVVRAYKNWQPQKPSHKKIKAFIDAQETTATHIESDKAFLKGQAALPTRNPPL